MKWDELIEKVRGLNDERVALIKREGQQAIAAAFKEVFDAYPELESVSWTQYTPYFNDGDACTFAVHDFDSAVVDGEEVEEPYYADKDSPLKPGLVKALSKLNNSIGASAMSDTMELIFGDHAKVTATRNGFEVDEYSHD